MDQDPKMQGNDLPRQDNQTDEPTTTSATAGADNAKTVEAVETDVSVESMPTHDPDQAQATVNANTPTGTTEGIAAEIEAEASATEPASEPTATSGAIIETTVVESVAPAPVTNSPAQSVVDTPPKTKSKGLVALIIILAVLVLGAIGAAIWYFAFYSNPDKVALDAVSGFLRQQDVVVTGSLHSALSDGPLIDAALEADTEGIANSSTLTLAISPQDANGKSLSEDPYQIKLSNVMMSDGVFYLRGEDLIESLNRFYEDNSISVRDNLEAAGYATIVELVDDEWWQISIPDIIDALEGQIPSGEDFKELYTCSFNVLNDDLSSQRSNLYKEHPFINVAKITSPTHGASDEIGFQHSLYSVTIDYDQLANFSNAIAQTDAMDEIYNCVNHFLESQGSQDRISSDDLKVSASKLAENDPLKNVDIELEINNFNHHLVGIGLYGKNDLEDFTAQFKFKYQPVSVVAPENYRPITELVEEIFSLATAGEDYDEGYFFGDELDDPEDWYNNYYNENDYGEV